MPRRTPVSDARRVVDRSAAALLGEPGRQVLLRPGAPFSATLIAELGARLRVPVRPAPNGAPAGGVPAGGVRGLVLGVGHAGPAAAAYAGALGREFRSVARIHDPTPVLRTAAGHGSAFLILPERELTFELASRIMEASRELGLPVGVAPIPAEDTQAALVLRLLLLHAMPRTYATRSALYCDFVSAFPAGPRPDAHVFGTANAAGFHAVLTGGAEAAVIHSHGNGADFRVGSGVLCVQVGEGRPERGRPGERFLPCQGTGPCRLDHKRSFTVFHGPGAIRVRLLVLISCSAYQPAGGLLDPRFQFIRALLRYQHVAAVITSTRINFTTPELGLAVLRSLRAGVRLGEITLRMNQVTRYGPPAYLCLGDPESQASPDGHAAPPPPPASPPPPAPSGPATRTQALLFAADALELSPEPDRELAERLRVAAVSRVAEPGEPARWMARAVGSLGPADPAWVRLFRPASTDAGPACPACGRITTAHAYDSTLYRAYRRILVRCHGHGVLADLPDGFDMRPPAAPADTHVAVSDGADAGVWRIPGWGT